MGVFGAMVSPAIDSVILEESGAVADVASTPMFR